MVVVELPGQRAGSVSYLHYGYRYVVRVSRDQSVYLVCTITRCPGRGVMALARHLRNTIRVTAAHDHDPEPFVEEVAALRARIVQRCAIEPGSLQRIFNEECASVASEPLPPTPTVPHLHARGFSAARLTHVDPAGRATMVDVGGKPSTSRSATASACVRLGPAIVALIAENALKMGDVLHVAELAGVMAAKRTSELVPLCHNVPLSVVTVWALLDHDRAIVEIEATAKCEGRTGVEMEALMAATVAALTVYDMCKTVSHDMVIDDVRLERKEGGVGGEYRRRGKG